MWNPFFRLVMTQVLKKCPIGKLFIGLGNNKIPIFQTRDKASLKEWPE
jgi:hypothetical protein